MNENQWGTKTEDEGWSEVENKHHVDKVASLNSEVCIHVSNFSR